MAGGALCLQIKRGKKLGGEWGREQGMAIFAVLEETCGRDLKYFMLTN